MGAQRKVVAALAERSAPAASESEGALDAWSQARERAREILRDHTPQHLDDRQDAEIRRRFTILA